MKRNSIFACSIFFIMLLTACQSSAVAPPASPTPSPPPGQIYLYGEVHGKEEMLDAEFEAWQNYYETEGMRHLFVEKPLYTAEFLNLWMQADNDDILDAVYDDSDGTQAHVPAVKAFYQRIKEQCPETIFHGTDVGHQHQSTGSRFLTYLAEHDGENAALHSLVTENIEQGKYFYSHSSDAAYRENTMTANFIRAFDALNGESVMGIYGAAHIGLDDRNNTGDVPSMANQLKQSYGDNLHSVDLSAVPLRVDTIEVDGKAYQGSYFGSQDMTSFSSEYTARVFWRLENTYALFAEQPKTGGVLPYDNYPMPVEAGQVFVIDLTKIDGTIERRYFRSDDGDMDGDRPTTVEFTIM